MKKKAARAGRVEAGLHLVVNVEKGRLTILRSAPIRNAPRRGLRPPFLDPSRRYGFTAPVSEMVLDLLDLKGRVVESFGWPWTAEAFFDQALPELQGGLQGGRFESALTLRVLLVPVPKPASLLLFSRSDVEEGTDAAPQPVKRTALALYSVGSPPTRMPPLPFPARDVRSTPLPGPTPLPEALLT